MNKRAIISCAVGFPYSGWLPLQQANCQKICPEIHHLTWLNQWPPNSRSHSDSPYGFKVHAFRIALALGFKHVLWLDSSIFFLKHPQPLFDLIEQRNFCLLSGGTLLNQASRDDAHDFFKVTRQEADNWRITTGGILGFNFENNSAVSAFEEWADAERKNYFCNNGCASHRHDETCLGFIAGRQKLPFSNDVDVHWIHPSPICWNRKVNLPS